MTIHYTATLNNKHLSLIALYPDGNREVIAILPVTELGALINRNNRLMHLSFSSPFREITETVLVDTVDAERPGHHIGRMLSAIDLMPGCRICRKRKTSLPEKWLLADTDVWLYRRNCSAGDSCRLPLDEGRAPFHAGLPYISGMES